MRKSIITLSYNLYFNLHVFFLLFSYIFPGVGLAAIVAGSTCITEDDFYVAAQSLASQVIIAKYNKFHV